MAKFATKTARPARKTPITATTKRTRTHEGGAAFTRDAKSDLYMLAISNLVGERTFYESAESRDARFVALVHEVTQSDPAWVARMIPWLRNSANMRSASIQAAAEYVRAGGPGGRQVIANTLARADEPAELLAYWISTHGKAIPKPVKRGVSDAMKRLYNERSLLKYDGSNKPFRFADVINLVHPKPGADWQRELYKYALTRRFDGDTSEIEFGLLPMIETQMAVRTMAPAERRALLNDPERFAAAGFTWESASEFFGKMDREVWEAMIPNMGYMALLRNLRNFDQAGVSDEVAATVVARLTDPEQVAKSRQFPFRFLSAYLHTQSTRWSAALDKALDLSTQNIPTLGGSTLILTDTSGSMTSLGISARSTITPAKIAALFAAALAKKGEDVTLVEYASSWGEQNIARGGSVLRHMEQAERRSGKYGHGTNTFQALRSTYKGQDRVVIFTDGQSHDSGSKITAPVYAFNLGGYAPTPFSHTNNMYEFGGGFSDQSFTMLKLLDEFKSGDWPF